MEVPLPIQEVNVESFLNHVVRKGGGIAGRLLTSAPWTLESQILILYTQVSGGGGPDPSGRFQKF